MIYKRPEECTDTWYTHMRADSFPLSFSSDLFAPLSLPHYIIFVGYKGTRRSCITILWPTKVNRMNSSFDRQLNEHISYSVDSSRCMVLAVTNKKNNKIKAAVGTFTHAVKYVRYHCSYLLNFIHYLKRALGRSLGRSNPRQYRHWSRDYRAFRDQIHDFDFRDILYYKLKGI